MAIETIEINDVASFGVVNDVPSFQLPPEVWTFGLNLRFRDGGIEKLLGWDPIFGTPPVAPHFLLPIQNLAGTFWIYTSLTKAYVYDGSTHTEITRLAGNYAATETKQWNGTILGGVPYLNNGVDVPQYRPNMTAGTKLIDLINWPPTLRCRVLRAMSPYLMAFGLTDAGTALPHTIQWSHPADPGAVPSSWDYTDPSKDAGRKDLDDVNSGVIMDALPLSSAMYVYKGSSTWRAVPIGGRYIFDWKTVFETLGTLAPRCVVLLSGSKLGETKRHCVVTQDDIIWHNGQRVVSILNKKQRATLFGEIDTSNYENSFLFDNPLTNEAWFCYPTQGNTQPNKALIWNYAEGDEQGVVSFADGITFRHAAVGNIQSASEELWSDGNDTWEEDTGPWSEFARRRVVTAGTDATKFYNMDRTSARDGVVFSSVLSREALALLGRKRTGQPIVDWRFRKMFSKILLKMQGGPINIRIGKQDVPRGPVTWGNAVSFDPSLSLYPDLEPLEGVALALEISDNINASWRLDGYQFDVARLGQF